MKETGVAKTFAERFVRESAAIESQNIPANKVGTSGHMRAYEAMLALADVARDGGAGDSYVPDADLNHNDLKNFQRLIGGEQHLWGDRSLAPDELGAYRKHNIVLSGVGPIGAQWTSVEEEMNELWDLVVNWTGNVEWLRLSPLEKAAHIHHTYERIHPFPDGNGRSGRLLATYILRRANVPPVLFTARDRVATYYPCFPEKSPERMVEYFRTHQVESWE